jgi:TIR domain
VVVRALAMADVFISYAKTDRPLALKLAAMLEAEGWKVWWDTSLTIGDDFRNDGRGSVVS